MNDIIANAIKDAEEKMKKIQKQLEYDKGIIKEIQGLNNVWGVVSNINKIKLLIEKIEKLKIPVISTKNITIQELYQKNKENKKIDKPAMIFPKNSFLKEYNFRKRSIRG